MFGASADEVKLNQQFSDKNGYTYQLLSDPELKLIKDLGIVTGGKMAKRVTFVIDKEGKIAKASRGREPVYLFAALQRQLGYPEVPKPNQRDDLKTKLDVITTKLKELEQRLRLAEGEIRGSIDLSQFGKPDILKRDDEDD